MGSAASTEGADATKSTETKSTKPSESQQPPAAPKPSAAKRQAGKSGSGKRSASKPKDGKPEAEAAAATAPEAGEAKSANGKGADGTATDGMPQAKSTAKATDGPSQDGPSQDGTSPPPKSTAKQTAAKGTATKRKAPARPKTRYAVGQEIVYPLQGVGRIERLEEREFQDKPTLYYVVYLDVSDMTIMIPVDKADELGVRAIVSKRKAERALRLIAEDFDPIPTDWKLRYQMNLDLLKRGAVNDIASVVRSLFYRSKIKELPILERKLYDSAHRLLVDEVSYSLGNDKAVIEKLIEERLADVKQKGDE